MNFKQFDTANMQIKKNPRRRIFSDNNIVSAVRGLSKRLDASKDGHEDAYLCPSTAESSLYKRSTKSARKRSSKRIIFRADCDEVNHKKLVFESIKESQSTTESNAELLKKKMDYFYKPYDGKNSSRIPEVLDNSHKNCNCMVNSNCSSNDFCKKHARMKWKGVSNIILGRDDKDFKVLLRSINHARYTYKFEKYHQDNSDNSFRRKVRRRQSQANFRSYNELDNEPHHQISTAASSIRRSNRKIELSGKSSIKPKITPSIVIENLEETTLKPKIKQFAPVLKQKPLSSKGVSRYRKLSDQASKPLSTNSS